MRIEHGERTRGFARAMRREPTEAERRLWLALRGRRFLSWKFRRQVPIGPWIADFVCFEARLVIEVDGGQHAENVRDAARDRWFAAEGFRVLRLWNHEVLAASETALDAVFAALSEVGEEGGARARRDPSSAPSGHLLPQGEKGVRGAAPNDPNGVAGDEALARKRSKAKRSPSLLPSREKVAAQRPDKGARAAQENVSARRPDEGSAGTTKSGEGHP